ncbi:hypothetical protein [Aquimarina sediminis]|uniref:hypothetical protein n=1 Tax=Aquimarina sediminis TaxID=2070536 RepID=UPI000CA02D60|nr:hypothetical protein [Aquimarina sediminis]
MIKNILFLILTLTISGCQEVNRTQNLLYKVEELKAENDSLKNILSKIENKYVFDSIKYRIIPNPNNTQKLNSEYEFEFIAIGYNFNNDSIFEFDKTTNSIGTEINAYSMTKKNGGITVKTKLIKPWNRISFDIDYENKYGKKMKFKADDLIKVKK